MNNYSENMPKCLRACSLFLDGGFFVNSTSNPVSTTHFGQLKGLMTVTYSATGLYTVALASGVSFPTGSTPIISPNLVIKSGDTAKQIHQRGAWNNTTRTFVLQVTDYAGAAVAPDAADADRFVSFTFNVIDTQAR